MAHKHKIGDTIYRFDINRRVYRRNEAGRAVGGPIYREHFAPIVIVGEDGRSWILDGHWPRKIGKAAADKNFLTAAEVDDAVWRNEHRSRIMRLVDQVDAPTLRQIAALIGYVEAPDVGS